MFRVLIPGYGYVFVSASNEDEAVSAAQRYINQNQIQLETGSGDIRAVGFSEGSLPPDAVVIGSDGNNLVPTSDPGNDPRTNPSPPPRYEPYQPPAGNPISPTLPGDRGNEPVGAPTDGGGGETIPTPQPGGTPPATAQPTDVVTDEELSLEGTFRQFLTGQGIDPNSVLGRTAGRRQDQAFATLALDQLVNNLNNQYVDESGNPVGVNQQVDQLTGGATGFSDFLQGGGIQQSPGVALDALRTLAGIAGTTAAPVAESVGALFAGAEPGTTAGNLIDQGTLAALRTRLAPSVVNLLGGQLIQQAQTGFQDDLVGAVNGGDSPSYAQSILRSIFGIG